MNTLKKYILFPLIVIFACCLLAACGDDSGNPSAGALRPEDPHIVSVKEGSPNAYPGRTYGEAFEAFFGSPSWKYFKGTDDGSGKTYDVVEFTGNCMYQNVEVEALLQFTLDLDNGSFDAAYLSFNDVPQNMLMLAALIEAAFTNEDLDTAASHSSEASNPASSADAEKLYEQILNAYVAALTGGDPGDVELNRLLRYHQDLSEIGYTYLDINNDGTEELLIGEYSDGYIWDIYTIYDRQPKLVCQDGERYGYNICTDGAISYWGSGSAFEHSYSYYTLNSDGELCLIEAILYDSNVREDTYFYSKTSESIEDAETITFEMADQIMSKYTEMDIKFTSLAEYSDFLPSSANDTLPSIPVDTSFPFGYYEKDGGGAIEIGYSTDESQQIYFRFYKNRIEGYYGGSWNQAPDYEVTGDWFDVSDPIWNLTIDGVQVNFSITSTAMAVTAYGPIGSLSADQISGTYYCKEQAIGW